LAYNVAGATLIDLTSAYGGNVENVQVTGTGVFNLTGNASANTLTGNASNNSLIGNAGNDTLDGGLGIDAMTGGTGDDTYVIDNLGDSITELAGQGTDTVRINRSVDLTLAPFTEIENVALTGVAALNATGDGGNNLLTGNSAANVLNGGDGNDTLAGGAGIDTLRGGLGNDTYRVNGGDGQDTISENDSTIGNSDILLYGAKLNGATIDPLDLVLSRQANDLRIAIHGSTDRVTIQNWYSTPDTAQVETIQAGNGNVLLSTQVDQLIQAMAGFTAQTGLTWDQGIEQQPQDVQAVLAASWQ
jgi:Ca2+-binding RTX toxin-like protein